MSIDYDRNQKEFPNINVDKLQKYQSVKIYYKCEVCGYSYLQSVAKHSIGQRCPVCAGKTVLKGFNDLEQKFPDIASEWDFEKNELKPDEIAVQSNKMAYWKCKLGHQYQAIIHNRTGVNKSGCPICNRGNQTQFPEQVLYNCIKNKYEARNRVKIDGLEFDICIDDLKILIEYDGRYYHNQKDIKQITMHRKKKAVAESNGFKLIIVHENYEHTWLEGGELYFNPKRYNLDDFKILVKLLNLIAKTDITVDQNDMDRAKEVVKTGIRKYQLADFADIAIDWDYDKNGKLNPEDINYQQNMSVWWKCHTCGNQWQTAVQHRTVDKTGCPYCIVIQTGKNPGLVALDGVNRLETMRPEIFKQIDFDKNKGIDFSKLTIQSNKRLWWQCDKCGGSYQAPVQRRTGYNSGCPYCANRIVLKGFNDLKHKFPKLALEYDNAKNEVESDNILAYTYKVVNWKCSRCGNVWTQKIMDRTRKNKGCPNCQR